MIAIGSGKVYEIRAAIPTIQASNKFGEPPQKSWFDSLQNSVCQWAECIPRNAAAEYGERAVQLGNFASQKHIETHFSDLYL